jgi:peptidoglycan/xylan/chitin deacetylase (PgdA/CDA1 family)
VRAILTYHSIDDSGSPISVGRAAFERHVAWLRSGRVRVTSIPDLLQVAPGADAVAVTFDDGFANFATLAAPALAGLPVTLFVVTDHVGRSNEWGGSPQVGIPVLPLLDWATLGRLAAGGVTLGAHTRTHPDLRVLSPDRVSDELAGSAERIRRETGTRPDVFAYPYGHASPSVVSAARTTFRWACTTELRVLAPAVSMLELPRLDMYYFQSPGRLETFGSPRFRAYVALRRGGRLVRRLVPGGPRRRAPENSA